jgi:hypothetical protein
MLLMLISLAGMTAIYSGVLLLGGVGLDIHTMAYLGAFALLGLQMVIFAVFTKLMGMAGGWLPDDARASGWIGKITLERCILAALTLGLLAAAITGQALYQWASVGYGELDPRTTMRAVIPAITLLSFAGEVFLAGFFIEAIRLKTKRNHRDVQL